MMEKNMDIEVLTKTDLTKHIGFVKTVNKVKYVDKEYIEHKIQEIKNTRDKFFIKFLWTTGVRISEAINITKKDIYFEENIIQIRWLKKRKEQKRTIPIHKNIKELLYFYTARLQAPEKLFDFTRQRAHQITKKYLGINPHVFRHSFAVHYLKNGGRITDLRQLLGHSNINVTMIYADLLQEELSKEVNKIDY